MYPIPGNSPCLSPVLSMVGDSWSTEALLPMALGEVNPGKVEDEWLEGAFLVRSERVICWKPLPCGAPPSAVVKVGEVKGDDTAWLSIDGKEPRLCRVEGNLTGLGLCTEVSDDCWIAPMLL